MPKGRRNERIERECLQCGNHFTSFSVQGGLCSDTCRKEHSNKLRRNGHVEKICKQCNKPFIVYKYKAEYCSDKCRRESWSLTSYHRRKKEGICVRCRKQPAESEHVMCRDCMNKEKVTYAVNKEKFAAYKKEQYEKAKKAGMCARCYKRPAVEGHTRCQECVDGEAERMRGLYVEHKDAHICVKCKRPTVEDHVHCQKCIEDNKIWQQKVRGTMYGLYLFFYSAENAVKAGYGGIHMRYKEACTHHLIPPKIVAFTLSDNKLEVVRKEAEIKCHWGLNGKEITEYSLEKRKDSYRFFDYIDWKDGFTIGDIKAHRQKEPDQ